MPASTTERCGMPSIEAISPTPQASCSSSGRYMPVSARCFALSCHCATSLFLIMSVMGGTPLFRQAIGFAFLTIFHYGLRPGHQQRSEERRGGKWGVSTCCSCVSRDHYKKYQLDVYSISSK